MADATVYVEQNSPAAILRQIGMLVGIAASVALGAYVVMWARTPNFELLYSDLSDRDIAAVMDALTSAQIPHRINHESGAILVAAGEVDDARLQLAAAGLPKSAGLGFELLDEQEAFGTSQFLEKARYQRAIEGELARSITSIRNVRAARVHLGIPQQTVFARARKEPSASVVLDLYNGRSLEPSQVAAIAHLVSASVPNLPLAKVTIVDQNGALLTDQMGSDDMRITAQRFDYTRRLEASYVDRIEAILTPLVGPDGVRAQVTADLDFTTTEQTRESFNPDLPAVRSERLLQEERSGAGAGGVPGALSNVPPTAATAPEQATGAGATGDADAATNPGNRRSQTTRNYELDRTISHVKPSLGTIRRLSVAVVVKDAASTPSATAAPEEDSEPPLEEEAATTPGAYTAEQIERMTQLVKEAIGFDAMRGDTVSVTGAPFLAPPTPEPLPEPPIWQQPWVWNVAKQIMGGLFVLLLLFGVLRPAMKNLMAKQIRASDGNTANATGGADQAALPPGANAGGATQGASGAAGQVKMLPTMEKPKDLDQIKEFVNQEPRVAAQVVRNWVGE